MKSNITNDLLSENRYWTFWKPDWSESLNISWAGKTSWKKIVRTISEKLGPDCIYERQVELKEPDLAFE